MDRRRGSYELAPADTGGHPVDGHRKLRRVVWAFVIFAAFLLVAVGVSAFIDAHSGVQAS